MARQTDSSPPRPPSTTGGAAVLGIAVALVAFLAYLPAAWQGFVLGDDHFNFLYNDRWRGLSPEHLRWMATTFHLGHWQPLTWMTFGIDHALWGLTPDTLDPPEGNRYHILGLVLHAATAVLVFLLFRRLLDAGFGGRSSPSPRPIAWAAAGGAILWAVHPLRVENVAWATERRDLLSGFFLVATTLAYVGWTERRGRGRFAWVLGLYALSLCAKAWGMTLPIVLLAIDLFPLRRLAAAGGGTRGLVRLGVEKTPFVPLALAAGVLAARAQGAAQARIGLTDHDVIERATQAAYGLAFYVWKTVAPFELSTHYLLEYSLDPTELVHIASIAFVLGVTALLVVCRRRWPAALTAWFVYIVIVSPVLGALQSGLQKVADRYAYLAILPLCALAAAGLVRLFERPRTLKVAVIASGAVGAALFALTLRQTLVWESSVTLYTRAVAIEPGNYIAQMNLATAFRQAERYEDSERHARLSIAAEPGVHNVVARSHLASLRLHAGDFEGAVAAWRDALAVDPTHRPTLEAASIELVKRGRAAEVMDMLQAALAARPDAEWVRDRLAQVCWSNGQRDRAEALWREGVQRNKAWAAGHEGIARALVERGRTAQAENRLRRVLELEPDRIGSLLLLGSLLRSRGEVREAEESWRRVLRIAPGHPQATELLARSADGP